MCKIERAFAALTAVCGILVTSNVRATTVTGTFTGTVIGIQGNSTSFVPAGVVVGAGVSGSFSYKPGTATFFPDEKDPRGGQYLWLTAGDLSISVTTGGTTWSITNTGPDGSVQLYDDSSQRGDYFQLFSGTTLSSFPGHITTGTNSNGQLGLLLQDDSVPYELTSSLALPTTNAHLNLPAATYDDGIIQTYSYSGGVQLYWTVFFDVVSLSLGPFPPVAVEASSWTRVKSLYKN